MAAESGDALLMGVYDEGRDVHSETTTRLGTDRAMAKRINFSIITGITAMGLYDQCKLAGVADYDEQRCQRLIDSWLQTYRGVSNYMDAKRAEARRYGYVRDMWGRVRYLPGVHSPIPRVAAEALRQSHSHSIQAGAQGIMKVAMARIWAALPDVWAAGYWVEPLLQIHDELVWEMEPDAYDLMDAIVTDALTTAHLEYFPDYRVPLGAKGVQGPNWGALEK